MTGTWRVSDSMLDTVGGGGLYSAIEDMMRWAANFDEGKVGTEALARMVKPGALRNGTPLVNGYGMGLVSGSYRGAVMVSHSGSLAGYRTHFLRLPEKQFSVVCLCNAADAVPGRLAEQVADRWLAGELVEARRAEAPKSSPQPKLSAPDASLSSALAGAWWSEELQAVYRFRQEAGQLVVEAGDNIRAPVMVAEDGKLRVTSMPAMFELKRDTAGTVTSILMESGRVRGIELRRR
jgi:CubicO group peptidase (beta-lactamase class C family)